MSRVLDLTGQRFGWLTAIRHVGNDSAHRALWECRCGCGALAMVNSNALVQGMTRSCGCRQRLWAKQYMAMRPKGDSEMFDFLRTAEELPDYQTAWVQE